MKNTQQKLQLQVDHVMPYLADSQAKKFKSIMTEKFKDSRGITLVEILDEEDHLHAAPDKTKQMTEDMLRQIDREVLELMRTPLIDIGKDLFDDETKRLEYQHFDEKKTKQSITYFNQIDNETLFKEILSKNYGNFFLDGFNISKFDHRMKYLTIKERALLLQRVVEALDLDLHKYTGEKRKESSENIKQIIVKSLED